MNKQKGFDFAQPDRGSKKVPLVTLSVVEGLSQIIKNQVTKVEVRKIKNNKATISSTIPPFKGVSESEEVNRGNVR